VESVLSGWRGVFDTLLGPERTHAASLFLGGQSVVLVVPDRFEVIPQASWFGLVVVSWVSGCSGGCLRIAQWMRASLWSSY
jgi:hypothetical protein